MTTDSLTTHDRLKMENRTVFHLASKFFCKIKVSPHGGMEGGLKGWNSLEKMLSDRLKMENLTVFDLGQKTFKNKNKNKDKNNSQTLKLPSSKTTHIDFHSHSLKFNLEFRFFNF